MWTKREAEWEKEKQARERLMSEVDEVPSCSQHSLTHSSQVLLERQKQIRERMDVLKTKQVQDCLMLSMLVYWVCGCRQSPLKSEKCY